MPVTQKDIARKLSFSQSLVAGVLNDRPGVWVSEENRRRILDAAREMSYRPNAAARALRRGKTRLVACVFFGPVGHHALIETLAERLSRLGYDLLVKVIPDPAGAEDRLENLLAGGACDAVALWGLEPDVEPTALRLEEAGIPFAVKGRFEGDHPGWVQADFDHEGMMAQAVRCLAERGHRRIAYFGYDNGMVYTHRLREGFRAAMEALSGVVLQDDYECEIPNEQSRVEAQVDRWMDLPPGDRPTGVVVGTGRVVWDGLERGLARRGLKIGDGPEEFAVAGQGGTEYPLLFGDGYAYGGADLIDLADAMARELLAPLLAGEEPPKTILRLLPPLQPYPSFHLPLPDPSGEWR